MAQKAQGEVQMTSGDLFLPEEHNVRVSFTDAGIRFVYSVFLYLYKKNEINFFPPFNAVEVESDRICDYRSCVRVVYSVGVLLMHHMTS